MEAVVRKPVFGRQKQVSISVGSCLDDVRTDPVYGLRESESFVCLAASGRRHRLKRDETLWARGRGGGEDVATET